MACHTYGGEGLMSCLTAGVDAPNHLLELDDVGVKILLQKKLPFVPTVDDLISLEQADLRDTGGRNSRLRLLEQAVRRAVAAGVPIVFGSGATSERIPHGKQADQFKYYAKWGMSPVQALQTAYLPAARMLNYGWENQIGAIEKGKFADIIAVSGDPIADVTEMESRPPRRQDYRLCSCSEWFGDHPMQKRWEKKRSLWENEKPVSQDE